nr:MAG TPA: hypothetical protein [Caudoviricetes sp.]
MKSALQLHRTAIFFVSMSDRVTQRMDDISAQVYHRGFLIYSVSENQTARRYSLRLKQQKAEQPKSSITFYR